MTDCIFCGEPAVWLHPLDTRLASFRYDREGRTFGGDVGTCAGCEALWAASDDQALVACCVGRRDGEAVGEAEARVEVEVLRRADLGAVWRDDLLPPGAVPLRDAGLTPLEDVTGHQGVWRLWPEGYRRSVPETRPEWLTETDVGQAEGRYWLLRSSTS